MTDTRTFYRTQVFAVDGDTMYTIETPDRAVALRFLKTYDHEGAHVGLDLFKGDEPWSYEDSLKFAQYEGEEVYVYLEEK